jgi:predicted nucleotidyltransferase
MTISQIKKAALPILNAYGIQKAAVFGSVARGEETAVSDVDLLIQLPRPIGLLPFAGLKLELEDALHRRVDLVEYEALHPRIKSRVLADQIPILLPKILGFISRIALSQ